MAQHDEGLNDLEIEILAFEKTPWKYQGSKEDAIRTLFDISATRYAQVLNAVIDKPAAELHDPPLVRRLRRVREQKARHRGSYRR